jgi:FeS assembly SUF system protein
MWDDLMDELDRKRIEAETIRALRTIFDPEIPLNIYDLGLIYGVDVSEQGAVHIRMTLTSPLCPVAGSMPAEVENRVRLVHGVTDVKVELVWDPPWTLESLPEAARQPRFPFDFNRNKP